MCFNPSTTVRVMDVVRGLRGGMGPGAARAPPGSFGRALPAPASRQPPAADPMGPATSASWPQAHLTPSSRLFGCAALPLPTSLHLHLNTPIKYAPDAPKRSRRRCQPRARTVQLRSQLYERAPAVLGAPQAARLRRIFVRDRKHRLCSTKGGSAGVGGWGTRGQSTPPPGLASPVCLTTVTSSWRATGPARDCLARVLAQQLGFSPQRDCVGKQVPVPSTAQRSPGVAYEVICANPLKIQHRRVRNRLQSIYNTSEHLCPRGDNFARQRGVCWPPTRLPASTP